MNFLRRTKTTSVQVRRSDVPAEPRIIDIPGTVADARVRPPGQEGSPPPAPGQPNVTQNIFYISTPTPPTANPPPQEIHHHTTVHHAVRVMRRERSLSFFGTAGLVLGGLGCAAAFVPAAESFIHPLAVAGLAASGAGLLSAILFGRSGKGMPLLSLLVSLAAWGLWSQKNGNDLAVQMKKMSAKLPAELRNLDLGGNPQPPAPTVKPPEIASPSNPPPPSPVEVADAKARLESAREAAAARLGLDYSSARSSAEKARAEANQARSTYAPGTMELIAADQREVEADSSLKLIEQKLRNDPTVAEAEKAIGKK